MKKWMRRVAKLYPASWRQRYGTEFEALLDDTCAGWRDLADVFCGAMMMQMSMNYRNMTVMCGFAGLVLASGLAFWLPNIYVSRAVVRMSWDVINENSAATPLHGDNAWNERIGQITDSAFSRASLLSIIRRPDLDLYKNDRARKPLEDVIEEMKQKDIKIRVLNTNSRFMSFIVAFEYPDPVIAQKALQALVAQLVDANQTRAVHAVDRKTITALDLLDGASLPKKPTAPNRWQIVFIGLGAGVLAGIVAAALRRKSTT